MKIKLELKLTDRKDGSKMMKRGLAGWMCLALLGTLVCVPGKETAKAASQVTVASLDYAYSGTADVEYDKGTATNNLSKSKYGSKKKGYAFTQGSARLYASVCGTKQVFNSIDAYISGSIDEGLFHITGKRSEEHTSELQSR